MSQFLVHLIIIFISYNVNMVIQTVKQTHILSKTKILYLLSIYFHIDNDVIITGICYALPQIVEVRSSLAPLEQGGLVLHFRH